MKKILSAILIISLIMSMNMTAQMSVSAKASKGLEYKIVNSHAVILGLSDDDYWNAKDSWYDYYDYEPANESLVDDWGYMNSYVGDLVIPEKIDGHLVTAIAKEAFCRNATITSIKIPDSVTSIGRRAFFECDNLTKIVVDSNNPKFSSSDGVLFNKSKTKIIAYPCWRRGNYSIPKTVTTINRYAFKSCYYLTGLTIPKSVTNIIGNNPFSYCSKLKKYTVDKSNPKYSSLNGVLFNKNRSILISFPAAKNGSYKIPATVKKIEYKAFMGSKVQHVIIPNSVTIISSDAFSYCCSLTDVVLSNQITEIGDRVFEGCEKLQNIVIPDSVKIIGKSSFGGCIKMKNVIFGSGVETIGEGAFSNCESLKSITLPDNILSISNYLFYNCFDLTNIVFSKNLKSIGDSAFFECNSLTEITLPDSLISVKYNAFDWAGTFKQIHVGENNQNYSSIDGVLFDKTKTKLIIYPKGRDGSYTIPEGTQVIGRDAFGFCAGITSITVPDSVVKISNYAFYDADELSSIYFMGNAPVIEKNAFASTYSLYNVYYINGKTGFSNPWHGMTAMYEGQILVKSIHLNLTAVTLNKGNSFILTATIKPSNASIMDVIWKSANNEIATVNSSGTVQGIKKGTTVIYAHTKDGDFTAKCKVTIT